MSLCNIGATPSDLRTALAVLALIGAGLDLRRLATSRKPESCPTSSAPTSPAKAGPWNCRNTPALSAGRREVAAPFGSPKGRHVIGITTRLYRGFAILVQCDREASPPCRAAIRRRFLEVHPRPGVFEGASEDEVVSQAKAEIERILAGGPP
jgi:hypothetical protein